MGRISKRQGDEWWFQLGKTPLKNCRDGSVLLEWGVLLGNGLETEW